MLDRRTLLLTAGAAAVSACSSTGAAASDGPVRCYENGQWWTGRGFRAGSRCVHNGMFVRRSGHGITERIDLQGRFVTPPFADAHQHVTGPRTNEGFLSFGVFYVANPNVIVLTADERQWDARPDTMDTIYSMGGITAPGGHPEKLYVEILRQYVYTDWPRERFYGDAFHLVSRPDQVEPTVALLQSQGADFIKIYLLHSDDFERRRDDPAFYGDKGLDPALVPLIVRAAHARQLRVWAHIENAADFRVLIRSGVDQCAHMPGYSCSQEPLAQYAISDEDATAAHRAGLSVVTTALAGVQEAERTPQQREIQRANLLRLKAAGVPLYLGSDGGEHESVLKEARYLVNLGVFTPAEALQRLSHDTPRMIFPRRRIGVLAPGYEASFVTMSANPLEDISAILSLQDRVKQGINVPVPNQNPNPQQ